MTCSEQQLQVTMKSATLAPEDKSSAGKRLHREIVTVNGHGQREIEFQIPSDSASDAVSFAAFIGPDFESCLRHVTSKSVPFEQAAVPLLNDSPSRLVRVRLCGRRGDGEIQTC